MAVNRHDTPAQAQFMNTYVPIPFEQMMQAGAMKQNRYDQAAAASDQALAQAEQLTAIPNSMDEPYISTVRNTMRDIRDKYATMDLSDSMVVREMNNEINQRIDKERVRKIQESRAGWENYQKLIPQLDTPEELIRDFTGYDSSKEGIFTGTPDRRVDIKKATKEFFDDLGMTDMGARDVPGLPGYKAMYSEIGLDRALEHARNNAEVFAGTPAGRQLQKILEATGSEMSVQDWLEKEAPEHIASKYGTPFEYNTRGSNVDPWSNMPTDDLFTTSTSNEYANSDYKKINKEIDSNLNSSNPIEVAKGEEMELIRDEVESDIRNEYEGQKEVALKELTTRLIDSNIVADEKEAIDFVMTAIATPNLVNKAKARLGFKNVATWQNNVVRSLMNTASKVNDFTRSVTDALLEEGAVKEFVVDGDARKFLNAYNRTQELFGGINKFEKFDYNQAQEYDEFISLYFDEAANLDKQAEEEIKTAVPKAINSTIVEDYVVDMPIKYSNDFGLVIGPDGNPRGTAALPRLVQKDILVRPENYGITEKDIVDIKSGKTGKVDIKDLRNYEAVNITPIANMSYKNDYQPRVTIDLQHKEDESKYVRITVNLQPQHRQHLINDLRMSGNEQTALRLSHPEIDKTIDLASTSKGITVLPVTIGDRVEQFKISPDSGGKYHVTYGNVTKTANSRTEAKQMVHNIIYGLYNRLFANSNVR